MITDETKQKLILELKKPYYSIYETAEVLGVHHKTIRNHINHGTLKAAKMGRQWRIAKDDILKYINEAGDTIGTRSDVGLTAKDIKTLQELTAEKLENTRKIRGANADAKLDKEILQLKRLQIKLEKSL